MSVSPLTIWTNVKYPQENIDLLRKGAAPHQILFSQKTEISNLAPGAPDPALAQADIAFGQADPEQLLSLNKLRWLHLNTAGYTRYDRDDLRAAFKSRGAILTNSSTIYADPCAQHILAMMLAFNRQLPQSFEAQRNRAWEWRTLRFQAKTLTGQTALIAGFGAIGRRLVELLKPFDMKILATRRNIRGDETIPVHPHGEIARLLPMADHVINILPDGLDTEECFNADLFKLMKPSACFYNIGRGATVDSYSLRAALETRKLAGAYLDVTMPEPPEADDPIWPTPHCYLTPHIAGGQQDEYGVLVKHFLGNLDRFLSNRPLLDRIF